MTAEGRRRMVCENESLDRVGVRASGGHFHLRRHRRGDEGLHVTSYETNVDPLIPNYEVLLRMARRCGKLIVMCADLNLDPAVDIDYSARMWVKGKPGKIPLWSYLSRLGHTHSVEELVSRSGEDQGKTPRHASRSCSGVLWAAARKNEPLA